MCGLCGIWNYASRAPVDRTALARMTAALAHRGPDDEASFVDDAHGIGLGFRRLAILDLSEAGRQPMTAADGQIALAGNGEIYNFRSLREGLSGRAWRSGSDMEVALRLYEERGPGFVEQLHGMFALAVWDARAPRLLLARDRLGKKPLYLHDDGQRIAFASELKSLLEAPGVPRDLDPAAVAEYLALGYVASPRSILRGVAKLRPGHLLTHEAGRAASRAYWDWRPSFQPERRAAAEWDERIREVLRASVRDRLQSDVPLGVFLSGGVDSSAVVAAMAKLAGKVRTFSIGFAGAAWDERPFARVAAERFGTEHHELLVEPEDAAVALPRLARALDEPHADSSALPTHAVARLARQHVTVCLSGDGGDEAMAGYTRYAEALGRAWMDRLPKAPLRALDRLWPAYAPGQAAVGRLAAGFDERYALTMRTFSPAQLRQALAPGLREHAPGLPVPAADALEAAAGLGPLDRLQYLDARSYLPEDILVKVDRTSMACGLEVRCPLLDTRFLDLAARIPAAERLGKAAFKRALRGLVPDVVLDREKQGFGLPGASWLRGDLAGLVREVLGGSRTLQRGLLDRAWLRRVAEGALSRPALWGQTYAALMLELWCREYLDR